MSERWLKAAGIRALRTMAQAALALIGTNGIGITEVDWAAVASAAALAGIISVLMSIAGLPEVPDSDEIQSNYNNDGIGANLEVYEYEDEDDYTEE